MMYLSYDRYMSNELIEDFEEQNFRSSEINLAQAKSRQ